MPPPVSALPATPPRSGADETIASPARCQVAGDIKSHSGTIASCSPTRPRRERIMTSPLLNLTLIVTFAVVFVLVVYLVGIIVALRAPNAASPSSLAAGGDPRPHGAVG
jgi:hypothetical protein